MKKILTLTTLAALSVSAQAAITITNSGFTGLTGWTEAILTNATDGGYSTPLVNTTYAAADGVYAYAGTAAFQARNGTILEQNISTAEATAESFGQYNIGFVSGWRNNNDAPNNLTLRVSIWDVDADSELGHTYYTFPANSPTNEFNVNRTIGTQAISVNYDNSTATAGNQISLRFTADTSQDTFNVTGWIDDVTVTEVVPEPSSTALLGLGGLALLLRRRK